MSELDDAVEILQAGGLVGLPTETVYGLAGDAANAEAVAKIYETKNRPQFNPLIAHISSIEMAEAEVQFNDTARALASAFWPGPLTLVLPAKPNGHVCDLARAGLNSLAVRMPAHAVARSLISKFGAPIVAPSANRSGRISPTTANHVREEFGSKVRLVLDGGPSRSGLESTVIACLDGSNTLLRSGSLPRDDIETLIGTLRIATTDESSPRSPGMLSRHYAPDAKLRLQAVENMPHEALLGFGADAKGATLNLSPKGDLIEAAANLFAMLRQLDRDYERIAVSPIPETGLGEAINDRLRRAAL